MTKIEQAAAELREVYASRSLIGPLRDQFDRPEIDTAYAIQEVNTAYWLAQGRKITGYKIGLTSEAVQKQLGVDQPDYGVLFDSMCEGEDTPISTASLCQPRIEGEIAFVLGKDLPVDGIGMESLAASIDHACAAFEIVDSRIRDWDITIFDTIADNASSGKYVLGADRKSISEVDLICCSMELRKNGKVVSTGSGAACLGNPLSAALWLVQKMSENGRSLRAGDVILSGALGPFVAVEAGDTFNLEIAGFEGGVRACFDASC